MQDRPSLTAAAVALARKDPLPSSLMPAPLSQLVGAWQRSGPLGQVLAPALRAATFGMIDHIELRTAAIDAALAAAFGAGVQQLVLLGAGLDARAWRMPELRDAIVFEVDHPATQPTKRAWLGDTRAIARDVRFVSVDFERESIGEKLAALGHDPGARTAWVWEGVTPYLSLAAIRATLAEVGRISAPGSMLAVTYMRPELVPVGAIRAAAAMLFRALGEPLLGGVAPETMTAELRGAGFEQSSDTCSVEWAASHDGNATLPYLFRYERLSICKRR